MKTNNIKIIYVLIFALSIGIGYSQLPPNREVQTVEVDEGLLTKDYTEKHMKGEMKPRWICPYLRVRQGGHKSFAIVSVVNFSMQKVRVKLFYHNRDGKVVYKSILELEPKANHTSYLDYENFMGEGGYFAGSVELHADSPAVFPSSSYLGDEGGAMLDDDQEWRYTVSVAAQWHRIDL